MKGTAKASSSPSVDPRDWKSLTKRKYGAVSSRSVRRRGRNVRGGRGSWKRKEDTRTTTMSTTRRMKTKTKTKGGTLLSWTLESTP